jgi:hypothetical protein
VAAYEVSERAGDYVVLRLEGELIGDPTVERLHESLEEHYVDDGVALIRVDLRSVDFISLEGGECCFHCGGSRSAGVSASASK